MSNEEAQQVFDGAMLSDAQLARSRNRGDAYFNIAQSDTNHMDWLYVILDALIALGVELCEGYPKVLNSISKGAKYDYCRLDTKVSEFLTDQYYKWYPGSNGARGIKVVPRSFKLSPCSLAHWYMGDGGITFSTGFYAGYTQDHYNLTLSPAGFAVEDIVVLEDELRSLGLKKMNRSKDKRVVKGSGINITTHSIAEINRFLDVVEPYIVSSFKYKCRRPQYKINFRKPR